MTTPQPGSAPSDVELRVLAAYVRFHGYKGARTALHDEGWDIAEATLRVHLANLRVRLGVTINAELTYLLGPRLGLWT